MTEPGGPAWKQTTFHTFALTSRYARGNVLTIPVQTGSYHTDKYGEVPLVDAVATHDEETGEVALFLVNRSIAESAPVEVDLKAAGVTTVLEAVELSNPDNHEWHATQQDSSSVAPKELTGVELADGHLSAALPPMSWAVIRLG